MYFFLFFFISSKNLEEGRLDAKNPLPHQCCYVECSRYCKDATCLGMLEGTAKTKQENTLDRK
jgi:hypothetical protein